MQENFGISAEVPPALDLFPLFLLLSETAKNGKGKNQWQRYFY
jgi:hypothetical protein